MQKIEDRVDEYNDVIARFNDLLFLSGKYTSINIRNISNPSCRIVELQKCKGDAPFNLLLSLSTGLMRKRLTGLFSTIDYSKLEKIYVRASLDSNIINYAAVITPCKNNLITVKLIYPYKEDQCSVLEEFIGFNFGMTTLLDL